MAPKVEYLELEPQPAAKRAYTDKDIQTSTLSRECAQSHRPEQGTTKTQSKQGMINIRKQAKRDRKQLPEVVSKKGLDNNFMASAKGTNKPEREGLLGPRRNIM